MNTYKWFIFSFAIFSLFVLSSGLFVVSQHEQAIVLRLGKIEVDDAGEPIIKKPGLHFKIPLITKAHIFDVRLQTLDVEASRNDRETRIVTSEKKDLLVDYYIKWRITNLPLFYTRTNGNLIRIHTLLEQKINNSLRAEFGTRTIQEVVSGERQDIMALLREQAKASVAELGLDVVDVRIKRIDLPTEVSSAVYARMRAERERVATEHRAEGRSKSEAIQAEADKRVAVLLAEAEKQANILRGKGDAIAAKIYTTSYNRDEKFYAFYRSMAAYKESFSKPQDILVLKPDNWFFKHFGQITNRSKTAS